MPVSLYILEIMVNLMSLTCVITTAGVRREISHDRRVTSPQENNDRRRTRSQKKASFICEFSA